MVQKVTIKPKSPTLWTYAVEYGGRLLGIADFLKALVSSQEKALGETEVMQKVSYLPETCDVTDELEDTPRTPPWICGEADAICGFIECASS